MSEIAKLCITSARLRPETTFSHPRELVAEVLLTRGQKLAALDRWRRHLSLSKKPAAGLSRFAALAAIEDARTLLSRV
ncbi:MAG: hypothetical protein SFW09_03815 [Hyphomicrobiaceae bacterium]|nr:hypothetical protein [Hyphomicrobiaceae bacterium]